MRYSTILSGVVGSKAYGLDTASSDTDVLGLYVVPTISLTLLTKPRETIVTTKPDITLHEAGKYCSLALKCNPTVLELMWLPEHLAKTDFGDSLIANRHYFLSKSYVRNAYLGYATQQLYRIRREIAQWNEDGVTVDIDCVPTERQYKIAKHARHIYRLLLQGHELWLNQELIIKLTSREAKECHDFGNLVAAGDVGEAERVIEHYERLLLGNLPTRLPELPNTVKVESWLAGVRAWHLGGNVKWEDEVLVA